MPKRFRILVVDDEPVNIRLMTAALKGDYDVLTAKNGLDAICQIKSHSPDLILLDVMMPDLSGFDVCRIIKADELIAHIPVIFLTALNSADNETRGLELGGIDYLTKPINFALLKLRLRNHIVLLERNELVKQQRNQLGQLLEILTEREEALRQSDERLNMALAASHMGVWDWDVRTNAVIWSSEVHEIVGLNEFDGNFETFAELLHPDDAARVIDTVNRAVAQRSSNYTDEFRIIRPDGEERWLSNLGRVIYAADGMPLQLIGTVHDITDRKQQEKALLNKNFELESFTYTVSHDLKSPLITIQTYAGMILSNIEAGRHERCHEDLIKIDSATQKMAAMLDDLLKLSRIGSVSPPHVKVDMNLLVKDVLAQLAGPLQRRQSGTVVQPDLPAVSGDLHRLMTVLQNLVENAVKYMGDQPAPRIEIGARKVAKETVFFVADNGIGIDSGVQEKIFGLFNKLDSRSEGTGIGLALVKRIIETHGGRVWVESQGVGTGSTFCFTLGR